MSTPRMQELDAALEATRRALLDLVRDLDQSQLDRRPEAERWSVGEVLHHLARVETSVTELLDAQLTRAGDALPPDPDPGASLLATPDPLRVERPVTRVQAPSFALPSPALPRAALLRALERSRAALRGAMRRAGPRDLGSLHYPHPVLGTLDLFQWLVFVLSHERRHMVQLRELVGRLAPAEAGAPAEAHLPTVDGG